MTKASAALALLAAILIALPAFAGNYALSVATLILYFVGGPVLNDFAITMFIGLVVGTYSSVFIAAPIVLWWSGRGGKDLKTEVRKADEQPAVPA